MNQITAVEQKIFSDYVAFAPTLSEWRDAGDTIVFTNGCFDLLHRGHVDLLAKAADLGNRLIIGINRDDSVRRLKGKGRPFIDEQSRAFLLAALFFVDAVIFFGNDTPVELISSILPDILVKGSDYKIHEIAGHEIVIANGGRAETIQIVEGFSTTTLFTKIKNS